MKKKNLQAYVDDIVMFCLSALGLERLFYELEGQLLTNDVTINFQKRKTMIFTRKVGIFHASVLHVSGFENSNVKEYKYLGCILQ